MNSPARTPAGAADERFTTHVLPEIEVLLRVARSITANHESELPDETAGG